MNMQVMPKNTCIITSGFENNKHLLNIQVKRTNLISIAKQKHIVKCMSFEDAAFKPIGYVKTTAVGDEVKDRNRLAQIVLRSDLAEALDGVDDFSHLIVIFHLNQKPDKPLSLKVHPRGRADLPLVGVYATRTNMRPTPIGLSVVQLVKVEGNVLFVRGLDAYDGTPVLDIKPYDSWDRVNDFRVPKWRAQLEQEKLQKQALNEEKKVVGIAETLKEYIAVYVTTADKAQAEKIVKALLKDHLVACANIIGPVASRFRWQGKLDKAEEFLVMLKSRADLFLELSAKVKSLHSYEVPEIVAVPIVKGEKAYFDWMDSVLK